MSEKKPIMLPNKLVAKRIDDMMRFKHVKNLLNTLTETDEEVSIVDTDNVLSEAGFNPEEVRAFARALIEQEDKIELPITSPARYIAIKELVRKLVMDLLGIGVNRWEIKQALEGRIKELTGDEHILRKRKLRNSQLEKEEDSDEEETET